ncbi:GspE/PulE family protein [Azohydromonas lata]|uniref:GspE/PulE family protein n=1 Tax=Azohydromonas lata TaxID=45677 RepID=A0ABU5ID21_9BURK|nr:GspE/PulE family protein [Azohydromonas lata]MDZ5457019.1 GspE/PulE family protein [Azohydromonas lata]
MQATTKPLTLGTVLIEQGLLRPDQLAQALAEQRNSGQLLGKVLVALDMASEEQVGQAIARQLGLPFVDLRRFDVLPDVVRQLSEQHARRFGAVVLEQRGDDACLVGVVDPTDLRAQDALAQLLRRHVELAVITHEQLLATIDRIYRKTEQIGAFAREVEREIDDQDRVIDLTSMGGTLSDDEAPIVKLLQTIFDDAARVNASDIHFEPQEHALLVRFRIDGVLHVQVQADPRITPALIVRLKLMAQLDIAERRLPQDGRITVKSADSRFDIRMSTMPTQYGESVVLRLLRQGGTRRRIEDLMPPWAAERMNRAIRAPHGIVLVTGPTGSGKTTTLYAALETLNDPGVKILTAEDPVEYRMAGINQVQINDKIELTFARVLRSLLRQDPDVLLVGEIRDNETADIAVRAAMTGHMVLSTLHTNDAPGTPARLLDMGVPGYMIASTLRAVVAQRLLRVSCAYCAEPYEPTPNERAWVAHHASAHELSLASFRKGRGCSRCNGLGFNGRRGVHEVLEISLPLTEALQRADVQSVERLAREQIAGRTLAHGAVAMALEGRTTVAEAMTIAH